MGIFRQFPYSNFHEMNMDEIIKIVKNMLEEWAQYYAEWDAWMNQMNDDWSNYQEVMNEAWQNMQDFINNYFDNLDVQNEINNKITSMVESGELATIVAPYIPPRVTEWLTANITQPVGVVIDTSLTVAGACADAKATGDAITTVSNTLYKSNTEIYDALGVENLLPMTIQDGYFDTPSNSYILNPPGTWRVGTVDVTNVNKVKFNCWGGAIAHGWNFRDANDNLISHSTETEDTQVTGLELFVPENATTLILNAQQHGVTAISCHAINIIEAIDEFHRVIDNTAIYSDYNGAELIGLYPITTKEYYFNANCHSMIIPNFGILALKINCVAPTNCAAVMFYDDVPEASSFISSYGDTTQQTTHTNELVFVPSNAKYIVVNNNRTVMDMSVQVGTNKEIKPGTDYTYTIQTGGGYNDIVKGWFVHADYKGTLINCQEGDIFVVSTTTNGHNPLAIAWSGAPSEDTYLLSYDKYDYSRTVYENVVVVAPKGCTVMAFNGYLNNELIITHESVQIISDESVASGFYASIANEVLTVKPNRANNGDMLTVVMKKRGGNNFFDFDNISAMSDGGVYSLIESNVTDWIMPYKIRAVNNVDGDNTDSYYFTGGNHRSTNTDTGGVVTGVCDYLKYFVDGIETTSFSGMCNEVRVEWQNKVQAFNTTKEDGTGRMVMQCNHYLTIRDGEFKCRTILKPLEDVQMIQYYGYAMHGSGNDCYVRYIGSNANRVKTAIGTTSNSGDKKTVTLSIEKGVYHMELTLDKNLDWGDGANASNVTNDSFTAYNKTYWWIVNTTTPMSADNNYYIDATYKFF